MLINKNSAKLAVAEMIQTQLGYLSGFSETMDLISYCEMQNWPKFDNWCPKGKGDQRTLRRACALFSEYIM